MIVQVKLFAVVKQLAGRETIDVQVAEDATVADLRTAIADHFPELAEATRTALFAVDTQYATDATPLSPNAEIAVIPPVSGG